MSRQLWQNICQNFINLSSETQNDPIKNFENPKQEMMIELFVSGNDEYNQLGGNSNNENEDDVPIISPPLKLSLDSSSLLSYSIYFGHSVQGTSDGLLKGNGNNKYGRIISSLQKTSLDHFICFSIRDSRGRQLNPVSAVCYEFGTLYMLSNERQLVLCDEDINGGDPVFLDISNLQPVSLFGGYYHSATICSEGEIIFINHIYDFKFYKKK